MLPATTLGIIFDDASQVVRAHLREHVTMAFWSVTRVENGRQCCLSLDDNDYDLAQGGSHASEPALGARGGRADESFLGSGVTTLTKQRAALSPNAGHHHLARSCLQRLGAAR